MVIAKLSLHCILRDTLKAFNDVKNKKKKMYEVMFFDM